MFCTVQSFLKMKMCFQHLKLSVGYSKHSQNTCTLTRWYLSLHRIPNLRLWTTPTASLAHCKRAEYSYTSDYIVWIVLGTYIFFTFVIKKATTINFINLGPFDHYRFSKILCFFSNSTKTTFYFYFLHFLSEYFQTQFNHNSFFKYILYFCVHCSSLLKIFYYGRLGAVETISLIFFIVFLFMIQAKDSIWLIEKHVSIY